MGTQGAVAESSCVPFRATILQGKWKMLFALTPKKALSRHFNGHGMLRGAKWSYCKIWEGDAELLPEALLFLCLKLKKLC